MNLRECFDRHECDKGSRHAYERVYEKLFEPIRYGPVRLLEIGVFRGASLAAWLDYFPHATIIGVDTFMRVKPANLPILKHPRIIWKRCNSTFHAPGVGPVDIVIDDGYHTPDAQLATFWNYFPLVKEGGLYLIEDVDPEISQPLFDGIGKRYRFHDLRDRHHFGSCIVEVRK